VQDLYKINLRLLTIRLIQAGEHFLTSHMTDQKAKPSVHHTEWTMAVLLDKLMGFGRNSVLIPTASRFGHGSRKPQSRTCRSARINRTSRKAASAHQKSQSEKYDSSRHCLSRLLSENNWLLGSLYSNHECCPSSILASGPAILGVKSVCA
jgi:hypothetical protein